MRAYERNWMQIEEYLAHDDRVVLPIGSVEQHGYLSVGTDALLAERVAVEAAEPLGVLVLPAVPYGITPSFAAFPGSPSVRTSTLVALVTDLLDSLYGQGFRRILIINGHGGNLPAGSAAREWLAAPRPGPAQVVFHSWWNAPRTWAAVQRYETDCSHGSWFENFPWTRLDGVELPPGRKPLVDLARLQSSDAPTVRELTGDGSFGGSYARDDDDVLDVWRTGVEEVREVLESGWAPH